MKDFVISADRQRGIEHAGKGTVQREVTLRLYQDNIDRLYQAPALLHISPKMLVELKKEKSKPLREALLDIVTSCIDLNLSLDPSAYLFDLGIDFLQITSIAKEDQRLLHGIKPRLETSHATHHLHHSQYQNAGIRAAT